MKLVSGIVDSGFFAQSALSAEVATKDSLGRNISETYLTGVDLTPYQTIAGMTAYQSAGDYQPSGDYYSASNPSGFLVADDITGKLDASVYAADSGSFLTGVPDTYLQNTDLTITDGKVTEISGVPLSAGDELPSGVMNTSALEYNAVNEISGYNGSAIAQYGAEKQWLTHDDTLVHLSNSAQFALGVNLSAVAQLLGVDETVLFSGTGATGAFSEPLSAFKKVEFHLSDDTMIRQVAILYPDEAVNGNYIVGAASIWQPNTAPVRVLSVSGNMNEFSRTNAAYQWWAKNDGGFAQFSTAPIKVIGIGRKEV